MFHSLVCVCVRVCVRERERRERERGINKSPRKLRNMSLPFPGITKLKSFGQHNPWYLKLVMLHVIYSQNNLSTSKDVFPVFNTVSCIYFQN